MLLDKISGPSISGRLIKESRRGGTYLKVTMPKVCVPTNPKKEWGCVWHKSHEAKRYDVPWDADPANYQIFEIIFKESPFDFLKDKLGCRTETIHNYDREKEQMVTWDRVCFEDISFQTEPRPAKPTPEVRRAFLTFLLHIKELDIMNKNIQFIEVCRASPNTKLQRAAANFHAHSDLPQFYHARIGDALSLKKVSWERLYLSEHEILTKDYSIDQVR